MNLTIRLKSAPTVKLRYVPGLKGEQGDAGTVTVDPATITGAAGSNASVSNTGTPQAAVLKFTIPRGDTGAQGPQGNTGATGATGPAVADGDKGDVVVSSSGTVWTVGTNVIGDTKLRQGAALTVIGRSANSTGNVADIAAGTDGHILRRSGTTLGFGTIATAGITNDAVDNTKLANMAANTVKGRITASTGDPEDLTAADVRTITGQKWVSVTDEAIASNTDRFTVIALGSYRFLRFSLVVRPNSSAASDFRLLWRLSTDGGATYPSGASDYSNQSDTGSGASAGAAASNDNAGFLTATISRAATIPGRVIAEFEKGSANWRPSMLSKAYHFNGAQTQVYDVGSSYSTVSTATHLFIFGDVTSCFGVGTRLIVEGLI
jgi:hypothetical protein